MINVIAVGKDAISLQSDGKLYEIDEQLNFKSAGVLITNKNESFLLLQQVCTALKEAQKTISAKETEIFALKTGEEASPLPSPPKAITAAKRKGVSLINPRLKKAGSGKVNLDFEDD